MDSLTQIALGIAVAEAVAGSQIKNRSFLYGAILGTLPDLDILAGKFTDPVTAVALHRGLSHSFLFFALLSPLLGVWISRLEKSRISVKRAMLMVFLVLATHALLDAMTTWGTQLFWPHPHRVAWESIFVIDPLYTLPLLVTLVAVFRTHDLRKRRRRNRLGLAVSSSYLVVCLGVQTYMRQVFEQALDSQNISYEQLIVKPSPFNIILWNAHVKSREGFYLGDYSFFDTKPVRFLPFVHRPELEPALKQSTDFKRLRAVTEGWYLLSQANGTYFLHDFRFGLFEPEVIPPRFAFTYVFDAQGNAEEMPREQRDGKKLLRRLGQRILGN